MSSRLLSFVIWATVAASAVFWGTRLFVRPVAVPPQTALAVQPASPVADLTRLFGAQAPAAVAETAMAPADSRFKLIGVVAPVAGQHAGLALIAVDGQAPRPVRVGARVEGDLLLRSVSHRRAELGANAGAPGMVLELPTLPEAARGVLPSGQANGAGLPAAAPQGAGQGGGDGRTGADGMPAGADGAPDQVPSAVMPAPALPLGPGVPGAPTGRRPPPLPVTPAPLPGAMPPPPALPGQPAATR